LIAVFYSCKKEEDKKIDKVISVQYDLEILKGTEATFRVKAKNQDYIFYVDYSYVKSTVVNLESWGISIRTSNNAGYEAQFNNYTPNYSTTPLEKGLLIDEYRFPDPYSSAYLLSAKRTLGQSNFIYENGFSTEFYKFYYIPIKFKTSNSNGQAGDPFYGYMLIYLHPDKIIIGNIVYNVGGSVSAGY
jgi:hypothetical protein